MPWIDNVPWQAALKEHYEEETPDLRVSFNPVVDCQIFDSQKEEMLYKCEYLLNDVTPEPKPFMGTYASPAFKYPLLYNCVLKELEEKNRSGGASDKQNILKCPEMVSKIIEHGPWEDRVKVRWATLNRAQSPMRSRYTKGDQWVPAEQEPGPLAEVDAQLQAEIRGVNRYHDFAVDPPGPPQVSCDISAVYTRNGILPKNWASNPKILELGEWQTSETFAHWLGGTDLDFIRQSQTEDPETKFVREQIEKSCVKPARESLKIQPRAVRAYIQQWEDLAVCRGMSHLRH
jgi:hypothetical protein